MEIPVADPDETVWTELPVAELVARSVRSGFVRLVAQGAQLLVAVISGVILARLLTPADFGLFAMVLSLTAFVASFRDFGFPMAAIQREAVDHAVLSALFWVAQMLNLITVAFMALMAPVLAWFYDEPRLIPITLVMAAAIFCLGLSFLHEALLMRQLRFGTLALIDTGSLLLGAASGITAALVGAGYWALVWQSVAMTVTRSAGLWFASRWRPRGPTRNQERSPPLRSLISYGGDYTAYRIIHQVGFNIDRVLVGYFSGATPMGLYDNAFRWSRYPVSQVCAPLLSVAVAGLSRLRDPAAYRAACRRGFLPVFSLVLPGLAFLSVEAPSLILVFLGEQWIGAIPLFRILTIAAFVGSLSTVTTWLYLSRGETRRLFRWGLVYTPVMVASITIGVQWGALGVAIGFTIASCLLAYPSIAYCLARSPLTIRDYLLIVWRPTVAAIAAAWVAAAVGAAMRFENGLIGLMMGAVVFTASYAAAWLALPGGARAAREVLRLAHAFRPTGFDRST